MASQSERTVVPVVPLQSTIGNIKDIENLIQKFEISDIKSLRMPEDLQKIQNLYHIIYFEIKES